MRRAVCELTCGAGMKLRPKESFRWTRRCSCCGPITSSLLIFLVNIVTHISLLSISCLVLNSPDELFGSIVDAIDTRDKLLAQSQIYLEIHGSILANPVPYFSIPIILNLILLISNLIATFGALFHVHRLLLPWLIFYFASIVSTLSLLAYILVILQNTWFRVILFLLVIPVEVIAISFWSAIFKLYRRIKTSQRKHIPKQVKIPLTVQLSSSVDHPVPIGALAIAPPQSAWDPEYLIERDPRFMVGTGGTVSEVDSYADREDSYSCAGQSDSYADRHGSYSDFDSGEETDYLSDEYTEREDREDTVDLTESETETIDTFEHNSLGADAEDLAESEMDILETYQDFKKSQDEVLEMYEKKFQPPSPEPEHYKTPGLPRPVSRSPSPELYSMPGTTLHSSTA